MAQQGGPWSKTGWLRRLAAIIVGGLFISSATLVVSREMACVPFLAIVFVLAAAILYTSHRVQKMRDGERRRQRKKPLRGGAGRRRSGPQGAGALPPDGEDANGDDGRGNDDGAQDGPVAEARGPKERGGKRPRDRPERTGRVRRRRAPALERGDVAGRERVLRCPQCAGRRLVYEAAYVTGQVYLCKDCHYRGSFVLDMDRPGSED